MGAIVVNTAVTEAIFGVWFIGVVVSSWPAIDWRPLAIAAVATNGIFPWFFYPRSKTVWLAFDLLFNPRRGEEGRRL